MEHPPRERGALPLGLDRLLNSGGAVLMSPAPEGPVALAEDAALRSSSVAQGSTPELCSEDLYSGVRSSLVPHFEVLAAFGLGLQQLQHAPLRALRLSRPCETRGSSSELDEILRQADDGGEPPLRDCASVMGTQPKDPRTGRCANNAVSFQALSLAE